MKGQQVSIFNFGSNKISSEGLKWDSYAYEQWWQGTLNESLGDSFSLQSDGYYLVYQTYDIK
jgi:thiamine pyrophosphokinase